MHKGFGSAIIGNKILTGEVSVDSAEKQTGVIMSDEKSEVANKAGAAGEPGFFEKVPWGQVLVMFISCLVLGALLLLVCCMMGWSEARMLRSCICDPNCVSTGFVNGLMIFLQIFFGTILLLLTLVILHVVASLIGESVDKTGKPCALAPLPGFLNILFLLGISAGIGFFLFTDLNVEFPRLVDTLAGRVVDPEPCGSQFRVFYMLLCKMDSVGATIQALFLVLMQALLAVSMVTPLALYIRAAVKNLCAKPA